MFVCLFLLCISFRSFFSLFLFSLLILICKNLFYFHFSFNCDLSYIFFLSLSFSCKIEKRYKASFFRLFSVLCCDVPEWEESPYSSFAFVRLVNRLLLFSFLTKKNEAKFSPFLPSLSFPFPFYCLSFIT